LPLKLPAEKRRATPAPAVISLLTVWLGLLTLVLAIAIPLVPGSRDAVAELMHKHSWAMADWVLTIAEYASVVTIFLGIVVFWQMRHEPRPLESAQVAQRVQAMVGIVLAVFGVAIVYLFTWLRGPRSHI